MTKNPTTGAQPKTTTAGAIVEKLEAWMLTQQISVDEITKFNALIDSLIRFRSIADGYRQLDLKHPSYNGPNSLVTGTR